MWLEVFTRVHTQLKVLSQVFKSLVFLDGILVTVLRNVAFKNLAELCVDVVHLLLDSLLNRVNAKVLDCGHLLALEVVNRDTEAVKEGDSLTI